MKGGKLEVSKKINKKPPLRKKEKNMARTLVTAILLIIISIITYNFLMRTLFITRGVIVVGSEKYTYEEIVDYVQIPMDTNIFNIDTDILEEKLFEDFLYIDEVEVSRKLPDKIEISITDGQPTYFFEEKTEDDTTKYDIYSKNFKLITSQGKLPTNLIGVEIDIENTSFLKKY